MPDNQAAEDLMPRTVPPLFEPGIWYWLREDGAVYSSDRGAVIAEGDAEYSAWTSTGQRATPWPKDANGNQTMASLQAVLPEGVYASLDDYAAKVLADAQAAGVTVDGVRVPTDLNSQSQLTNAFTFAGLVGDETVTYTDATGPVSLSLDEAKTRIIAIGKHMKACTAMAETVRAKIASNSIRAKSGVDKAFAELMD